MSNIVTDSFDVSRSSRDYYKHVHDPACQGHEDVFLFVELRRAEISRVDFVPADVRLERPELLLLGSTLYVVFNKSNGLWAGLAWGEETCDPPAAALCCTVDHDMLKESSVKVTSILCSFKVQASEFVDIGNHRQVMRAIRDLCESLGEWTPEARHVLKEGVCRYIIDRIRFSEQERQGPHKVKKMIQLQAKMSETMLQHHVDKILSRLTFQHPRSEGESGGKRHKSNGGGAARDENPKLEGTAIQCKLPLRIVDDGPIFQYWSLEERFANIQNEPPDNMLLFVKVRQDAELPPIFDAEPFTFLVLAHNRVIVEKSENLFFERIQDTDEDVVESVGLHEFYTHALKLLEAALNGYLEATTLGSSTVQDAVAKLARRGLGHTWSRSFKNTFFEHALLTRREHTGRAWNMAKIRICENYPFDVFEKDLQHILAEREPTCTNAMT